MKQMPWLIPMLNQLPNWFIKLSHPPTAYFREQVNGYVGAVTAVLAGKSVDKSSHITIFHALRDDLELPPEEKSISRLTAEATSLEGAGTLTSTHMLAITTYHVLANLRILETLLKEFETSIPDVEHPSDLQTLEKLP